MPMYGQSNEYKEESVAEEEVTSATVDETEVKPKKLSIPKIPILYGIISIGILLLILLVLFWAASKKQAEEERRKQAAVVEEEQFWLDYYEKYPDMKPTGESVDTAQQSNTPATVTLIYSQEQIKDLRKWGYTGSEIEDASSAGLAHDKLVQEAMKQRKEAIKDTMSALNDSMSPEYKNLLDKTWLSGEELNLEGVDATTVMNQDNRVENVDFEKCGAQGTQLFLKLHLDNGTSAFMCIDPQRYVELPDSGNIVVEITWMDVNSAEIIVGLKEVRVN